MNVYHSENPYVRPTAAEQKNKQFYSCSRPIDTAETETTSGSTSSTMTSSSSMSMSMSMSMSFKVIPMHGEKVFDFISFLGYGIYISPFKRNVTHSRFIVNDTHCMLGGVDFNKKCEVETYVQHAIKFAIQNHPSAEFIHIQQQVEHLVSELTSKGHLHNYSPSPSRSSSHSNSLIASSGVNCSAYESIIRMIQQAKHHIFIENQYFQHEGMLSAIAKRQMQCPSLQVVFVGNYHFKINPYHPGTLLWWAGLSLVATHMIRTETMKGLAYLCDQGCNFEFRTYRGKYTHNKIFIVDHGRSFAMGTFNLHTRGFDVGNDCEIGVLLNDSNNSAGTSSSKDHHQEEKKDGNAGDDHSSSSTGGNSSITSMASEYITSVMKETEILSPHFYYNNCNKNK